MIKPEDLTPLDRALLSQLHHLYADTVAEERKADRRQKNKTARRSRRTNRKSK